MPPDPFAPMAVLLAEYGLEELVPWARERFREGVSPEELQLALEEQEPYRRRFAAIFERRANGQTPISAADVISFERNVARLEQVYGMPAGFIDTTRALVSDVSEGELDERLALTADYVRSRTDVMQQYERLFVNPLGAAIASFVDPERALPELTRQMQMARISAEALRYDFGELTAGEADLLQREGVDGDAAAEGFNMLDEFDELLGSTVGERPEARLGRSQQLDLIAGRDPDITRMIQSRAARRRALTAGGGGFGLTGGGVAGAGVAD